MRSRGIDEGAFVEIVAASRDGSQRWLRQYRAFAYNLPRGSAAGNMPEMNVLLGPRRLQHSERQPLAKHIRTRVTPARSSG